MQAVSAELQQFSLWHLRLVGRALRRAPILGKSLKINTRRATERPPSARPTSRKCHSEITPEQDCAHCAHEPHYAQVVANQYKHLEVHGKNCCGLLQLLDMPNWAYYSYE